MPYITQGDRKLIDEVVTSASRTTKNAGELNYVLTRIALGYIERHGTRYATFNEVIGAVECAKLELYRRMVAPYEDTKMAENGDVYPNSATATSRGSDGDAMSTHDTEGSTVAE